MTNKKLLAALAGLLLLSGCQSAMLSDDRIADNTAGIIGTSPDGVTISGRHGDATNTYYTATLRNGRHYACVINGGGLLAAGLTNPPTCNPI
ncbi:hypothetical protein [Acidisphaera sp. L21]|uniref:hypothetical protein n=1 Tax=Acidisphaera sp. L21 TaxID=1641851 RepID=UPI00131B99D5|nr:hypothetical protein [Acidisphaera sp. L21]